MDFNTPENIEYCRLYVEQFSTLLLYSHIPTAIAAILIGIFIYIKSNKSLLSKLFLGITISFALWCVSDFMIWNSYYSSSLVMSFWAPIEIFSTSLFLLSFYFVYVFINQKDLPTWLKAIFALIILSIIVITPTSYNLIEYDIQECIAVENSYYVMYVFALRIILAVMTLFFMVYKFFYSPLKRKQIALLGLGILFFLFGFFVSGYFADLTGDYRIEMYGLFGMMVFIGTLAYLIVTFRSFNIKLIGAQALIISLVMLIGSQFAFIQSNTNRVLTGITFVLTGIIGINLIRSVKREISLREDLQMANEGQANLLHIVNHQIKGYFSKSRNIFAELISDEVYHANNERSKPMLEEGFNSLTEGVAFVREFLDSANIERGQYVYKMEKENIKDIVSDVANEQKKLAEKKGLSFELSIGDGNFEVMADKIQISQAVKNLIDNAINYTPHGEIKASLETRGDKVVFSIKDNGVGISDELKPRLFTEGARDKDSIKININSTGFGLSFVKEVVLAHKGRVWAESEGRGKGSTFYMELPLNS